MKYSIFFCEMCRAVYAETTKGSKVLGFEVVPQDFICRFCGEFLGVEEVGSEKTMRWKRR